MNDQITRDELRFGSDDDLNAVVDALTEGDSVVIGDRELPMEVFETARENVDSNQYKTTVAYLDFRGRTYRLRGETHYPNDVDDRPPLLELRQEDNWDVKDSWVEQIKVCGEQQILCSVRVDEWFGEDMDVR